MLEKITVSSSKIKTAGDGGTWIKNGHRHTSISVVMWSITIKQSITPSSDLIYTHQLTTNG